MSYCTGTSESSESSSECSENTYCVFLHIVEGIGLQRSRCKTESGESQHDQILMHASLNNVKFEIEGHSTETVTIFNSNCVWECGLDDLKRMKTDNRPIRIECYLNNGTACCPPSKLIGTLLLPVRGLPTIMNMRNYQPKLLWHKLGALCSDWRPYKPEIYLLLVVTKKDLIDNHNFEELLGKRKMPLFRSPRSTETTNMLQSRSNVYVHLLEQAGLIQVGNNPDIDCDIFQVTLTLRRIKDLRKLLDADVNSGQQNNFVFQYELLGSSSHDEITLNEMDYYTLNEKIALKFKTSMKSLMLYFQRIFYIPINIYFNGHAVANYRFDCSKYFPDENFFNTNTIWSKHGIFHFDRLHRILSPRANKPSVEFSFGLQLMECNSQKSNKDISLLRSAVMPYKVDAGAAGDNGAMLLSTERKRCAEGGNKSVTINESPERRYFRANSLPAMEYKCKKLTPRERIAALDKVKAGLHKHKCKDVGIGTAADIGWLNTTITVGVNTEDAVETEASTELMTLKIVQELEAWKSQQMEEFAEKLERKEALILRNLEKDQEKHQTTMQQCLEFQRTECEQLKLQLEAADAALRAYTKCEVTVDYTEKIKNLETDVERLKSELLIQQKQSTIAKESEQSQQQQEQAQEKLKLYGKNCMLKKSIANLEQQLISLGKTHFSAEQLKEMMTDLRQQTVRFADIEKQRNFFKEQYSRTARELRELKLNMLKEQELSLLRSSKEEINSCDFSIDDLTLETPISMMKSKPSKPSKTLRIESSTKAATTIRDMLLLHSETTSLGEDDSEVH